ncbi:hypothetical protein AWB76_07878 [Caballeronia temeraria]|uniref:Uncharacterized protein n=1 Tax=Caballeronia temeraria TaxID=1777137 RepID=A0A158E4F1_9BURK|nr:hypothetical protein AWB76_07878 [Caballeronia temeraria]
MRAFHAPLGRARVGAEGVDVQLEHRATELRDAVARLACGCVAKHRGLVAVECAWLTVALDVGTRGLKIAEGRLAAREMQQHQPAGGVVDVHQQRALRRTLLEPAMLAAVDLDQLTQTRTPGARLIDLRWALPAWHPQTRVRHQMPHRFLGQPDAVAFLELLARQSRAEVGVALSDNTHGAPRQGIVELAIARSAALARRHALHSVLTIAHHQPLDLAYRQAQALSRASGLQTRLDYRLDNLQFVPFAHGQAHRWVR